MAIEVQQSVTIARPLTRVQSFVSDIQNEEKYWNGVKSVRLLSGTAGQPGAKYERVFTAMGREQRTTIDVVESQPERVVVQSAPGPVSVRGTMTFAEVPEGTKVDVHLDAKTKGLFATLMKRKIRQNIENDTSASLLRLKQVLEAEQKTEPVPAPARSQAKTVPDTRKTAKKSK